MNEVGKSLNGFCSQFLSTDSTIKTTTAITKQQKKDFKNCESVQSNEQLYDWRIVGCDQKKPLTTTNGESIRNEYNIFGQLTPPFSPIDIDFLSKTFNSNCPLTSSSNANNSQQQLCDCCCCCSMDFKSHFESKVSTAPTDTINPLRTMSNGNNNSIPVGIAIARQRSNHELESQQNQNFLTCTSSSTTSFHSNKPLTSTRYFDLIPNLLGNENISTTIVPGGVIDTSTSTFHNQLKNISVPPTTTAWLDSNMFSMPSPPIPSIWQYPTASTTMSNQIETMLAMPILPPPPLFPSPFLPAASAAASMLPIGYQLVRDHLTGQFLILSTATNNIQQQTIYWPNLTQTSTSTQQLMVPQLPQSFTAATTTPAPSPFLEHEQQQQQSLNTFQILNAPESFVTTATAITTNQTFQKPQSVEAKLAKFEPNNEQKISAISIAATLNELEHNNNQYGDLNANRNDSPVKDNKKEKEKEEEEEEVQLKKSDDVSNLELLSNSIVDFVSSTKKSVSNEKKEELNDPITTKIATTNCGNNGALNMLCVLAEEFYQKEVKPKEPDNSLVAKDDDIDLLKKDECESKLNQKFDRISSNSVRNLSKFLDRSQKNVDNRSSSNEKPIDFKSCLISLQEKYKRKHKKLFLKHNNCDSNWENGAKKRKIERQKKRTVVVAEEAEEDQSIDSSSCSSSSSTSVESLERDRKRKIGPRLKAEPKMRSESLFEDENNECKCSLNESDLLEENLRVIYVTENRLCAGTLNLSPLIPLVYEFWNDDKRIMKPEYIARDDVFKSMMKEIRPESKHELRFGSKICARWSCQKTDFNLATLISKNEDVADAHLRANEVFVQFDDDRSQKHVKLEDIRFYNPKISFKNYQYKNRDGEDEQPSANLLLRLPHEHKKKSKKSKKRSRERGEGSDRERERHHRHHHRHRRHKKRRESNGHHHHHHHRHHQEQQEQQQEPPEQSDLTENIILTTETAIRQPNNSKIEPIADELPPLTNTRIWRWYGPKFYTRTKPRKSFYKAISDGFEIFKLNDTVVFGTKKKSKLLLGKICKLFEGNFGRKQVACEWYYHPEDLPKHLQEKRRRLQSPNGAVFECHDHTDINDVQSIDWKFEIVSYTEFINRTNAVQLAFEGRLYYKAGLLSYKKQGMDMLEFAADVPLNDNNSN